MKVLRKSAKVEAVDAEAQLSAASTGVCMLALNIPAKYVLDEAHV